MFLLNRRLSLTVTLFLCSVDGASYPQQYILYDMYRDFNKANDDIHMISTNGARALFLFLSPLAQVAAESLDTCGELLQCLPGHATEYTLLGTGILVL